MPPKVTTPELIARPSDGLMRVDAQALLSQALSANAPIDTVERMVGLLKDMRAWEARQAWFDALAKFQERCPAIPKSKHADTGTFAWSYSPLDQVLSIVRPILAPLGLTPRWKAAKFDGKSVSIVCILAHRLGHEEDSGEVVLPIPEASRGANSLQRAGGAVTYAKRVSLVSVLGVQPEDEDDDGNNQPGDYDHEGPPRTNPAGPEAERPLIIERIRGLINRHRLNTEERLQIGADYLPSGRMDRASVDELKTLEMFLSDDQAVKDWRAERANVKPEQGELGA
jgi:hypothetical protein